MYGGGIKGLKNNLPISIKLLFDNKYFDYLNVLCTLYAHKKKKKGIKFTELVYWYTLLNCLNIDSVNQYKIENNYLQNNYLNYENILKKYLITLANHGYIDIQCENTGKNKIMQLSISRVGIQLIDEFEHPYINSQISKINYLKKEKPFNSNNERGILINR